MVIKLTNVIFVLPIKRLIEGTLILLVNEITGRYHLHTTIEKSHVQLVKLANVNFTLSMEVLIGVIFTQLLKVITRKITILLGSHGFVVAKKLYYFVKFMYLGVSALTS